MSTIEQYSEGEIYDGIYFIFCFFNIISLFIQNKFNVKYIDDTKCIYNYVNEL